MNRFLTLGLSALAACAAADNRQGFYLGGGVGLAEFSDGSVFDNSVSDTRFRMVELLGGYKYNSALGLEVRVGTGVSDEDATLNQGDTSVDQQLSLEGYQSIYYRPELVNPEAKLYGLLGYSQVERSAQTGDAASEDNTESGLSYGVGVGFVATPTLNLNFEYKRLLDKSDFEVDSAMVNLDYRF